MALKDVSNYIKNMGKSVAYSMGDISKETAPAMAEFVDTNKELFTNIYATLKDHKKLIEKTKSFIVGSKIYEAADLGLKNIKEDIKTGNFYNKAREAEYNDKFGGFNTDDDLDIGEFMSSGGDDFGGDDNFDDIEISESEKTRNTIEVAAKASADLTSTTIAKSAEYTGMVSKINTNALMVQNEKLFGNLSNRIVSMHSGINDLYKLHATIFESSSKMTKEFYTNSTDLMRESNAMLKEILEMQRNLYKAEQAKSKEKVTYDDIIGSNGMPDLTEYFKVIKKNFKSASGGILDSMDMLGKDGNMLATFVASPLKGISDFVAKAIIPAAIASNMEQLDKTMSGVFGTMISRFNMMAKDDENPIAKFFGKLFGISNNVKTSIDTNNYNKGTVPLDGIMRKSIVEVIPGYLRRIEAILSGNGDERVYDHDKGKWTSASKIQSQFDSIRSHYQNDAFSDVRTVAKKYVKNAGFSKEQEESFNKDFEIFLTDSYNKGGALASNLKKMKKGDDLNISDINFEIIKKIIRGMDRGDLMQLPGKVMTARNKHNKEMIRLEESGSSLYNYLFDGSAMKNSMKDVKTKDGKVTSFSSAINIASVKDELGNTTFFYLQNILRSLEWQKLNWTKGGIGGSPFYGGYTNLKDITDSDWNKIVDNSSRSNTLKDNTAYNEKIRQGAKDGKNAGFIDAEGDEEKEKQALSKLSSLGNRIKDEDDRRKEYREKGYGRIYSEQDDLDFGRYSHGKYEKGIVTRLREADSLMDKYNVISEGIKDFAKSPASLLASVIDKANQSIFSFFYEDPLYDEEGNKIKGFMDLMISKMKTQFEKFNKFLDEKILDPILQKLGVDSLGDAVDKLLGKIGLDKESRKEKWEALTGEGTLIGDFKKGVKDEIDKITREVAEASKKAMKETYGKVGEAIFGSTESSKPVYVDPMIDVKNKAQAYSNNLLINKKNSVSEREYWIEKFLASKGINTDHEKYEIYKKETLSPKSDLYTEYKLYRNNYVYSTDEDKNKRHEFETKAVDAFLESQGKGKSSYESQGKLGDYYRDRDKFMSGDNGEANIQAAVSYKKTKKRENSIKKAMDKLDAQKIIELNMKSEQSYVIGKFLEASGFTKGEPDYEALFSEYLTYYDLYEEDVQKWVFENLNLGRTNRQQRLRDKLAIVLEKDGKLSVSDYEKQGKAGEYEAKLDAELEKLLKDKTQVEKLLNRVAEDKKKEKEAKEAMEKANTDAEKDFLISQFIKSKGISDINSSDFKEFYKLYSESEADYTTDIEPWAQEYTKSDSYKNIISFLSKVSDVKKSKFKDAGNLKEFYSILSRSIDDKDIVKIANEYSRRENTVSPIDINPINPIALHAKGARMITKAGLTMISPGEAIIPADMNPFNPNRDTVDTNEQLKNEKRLKNKFIEGLRNKIGLNNEGANLVVAEDDTIAESKPLAQQASSNISKGTAELVKRIILGDEKQSKAFNEATEEIKTKVKEFLPSMAASGLIGGGVGLLTGIGSPILGAVAGAGLGLLRRSDKMQDWLFGKIGEDGREGGVISKETQKAFQKYLPDLQNFGIAGALTGLFTPFGPVGGLMIGSAIAYVKNNDKFAKLLYGDETGEFDENGKAIRDGGIFGKSRMDALKKAAPNILGGAALGVLLGPGGGILTKAALGAGVGLLTTTDGFKDLIFGEADKDGNRTGGIAGAIHDGFVEPLKEFGRSIKEGFDDFIKKDILEPLAGSIEPIATALKDATKGVLMLVPNMFMKFFENKITAPLADWMEDKIFNPLGKATKFLLSSPVKLAKMVVSAPFKAVGALGNFFRTKQIQQGRADYMTAQERLNHRSQHKISHFLRIGRDKFKEDDEIIANLDATHIQKIRDMLDKQLTGGKKISKDIHAIGNEIYLAVNRYFKDNGEILVLHKGTRRKILEAIQKGNYNKAINLIRTGKGKNGRPIPNEEREALLNELVPLVDDYENLKARQRELESSKKDDLNKIMNEVGFKKFSGTKKQMRQYAKLFTADYKAYKSEGAYDEKVVGFDKAENNTEELVKSNSELIDAINKLTEHITQLTDPAVIAKISEENDKPWKDNMAELENAISSGKEQDLSKARSKVSELAKIYGLHGGLYDEDGKVKSDILEGLINNDDGFNLLMRKKNDGSDLKVGNIGKLLKLAQTDNKAFTRLSEMANFMDLPEDAIDKIISLSDNRYNQVFTPVSRGANILTEDGKLNTDAVDLLAKSGTRYSWKAGSSAKKGIIKRGIRATGNSFRAIGNAFKGSVNKTIDHFFIQFQRLGLVGSNPGNVCTEKQLQWLYNNAYYDLNKASSAEDPEKAFIDLMKKYKDKLSVPTIVSEGEVVVDELEETTETRAFGKLSSLIKNAKESIAAKFKPITNGDISDSKESHDAAKKEQMENERTNLMASGIQTIVHMIEDWRNKYDQDKSDEEEGKGGFWGKVLGALAVGGKVLGTLGVSAFGIGIYKNYLSPVIKSTFNDHIKPWWIDTAIPAIKDSAFGQSLMKMGDYVTGSGEFESTGGLKGTIANGFDWILGRNEYNGNGLMNHMGTILKDFVLPNVGDGLAVIIKDFIPPLVNGIIENMPKIAEAAFDAVKSILSGKTKDSRADEVIKPTAKDPIGTTADGGVIDADGTIYRVNEDPDQETRSDVLKEAAFRSATTKGGALVKTMASGGKGNKIIKGTIGTLGKTGKAVSDIITAPANIVTKPSNILNAGFRKIADIGSNIGDKFINSKHGQKFAQSGFGKAASNVTSSISKFMGVDNTTDMLFGKKPTEKTGSLASKAWDKFKGLFGKNIDDVAEETIENVTEEGLEKAAGEAVEDVTKKATKNVAEAAAEETGEKVAKGTIEKMTKFVTSKIKGLFENKTVVSMIKKCLKNVGKEASDTAAKKIAKEVSENFLKKILKNLAVSAGKLIGKAAAKLTSAILSGGLISLAFIVADFISGMSKANIILGVTETSVVEKLLAGLINAITENLTFGIIPADTIVTFVLETVCPAIGVDTTEMQTRRDEAIEAVNKWNAEHPDDMYESYEDYYKGEKTWGAKVKNTWNNFWGRGNDSDEDVKAVNAKTSNIKTYANSGTGTRVKTDTYISANYGMGITKHLSQTSPIYSKIPYNTSKDTTKQTIGDSGCGPIAAAQVIQKYTGTAGNPIEAAKYAIDNNYKEVNGGTIPTFFKDYLAKNNINTELLTNIKSTVDKIGSGQPVILMGTDKANSKTTPYGTSPHYVVATGFDRNGNIIIQNPESSTPDSIYNAGEVLSRSSLAIGTSYNTVNYGKGTGNYNKIMKHIPRFGRASNITNVNYMADDGGSSKSISSDYIGKHVKKFESGTKGSLALVQCGNDWGLSCGSYQLTLRWGNCITFLKKYFPDVVSRAGLYFNSSMGDKKSKVWPGAEHCSHPDAVKAVWKECYKLVGTDTFFKYEWEYIRDSYYIKACNLLADIFNPNTHSRAMQDCIWSWSVHRGSGGCNKEFRAAITAAGIKDPQHASTAALLKACYDYRYNSFSDSYRYSTRSDSERFAVAALDGKKPINFNGYPVGGSTAGLSTAQEKSALLDPNAVSSSFNDKVGNIFDEIDKTIKGTSLYKLYEQIFGSPETEEDDEEYGRIDETKDSVDPTILAVHSPEYIEEYAKEQTETILEEKGLKSLSTGNIAKDNLNRFHNMSIINTNTQNNNSSHSSGSKSFGNSYSSGSKSFGPVASAYGSGKNTINSAIKGIINGDSSKRNPAIYTTSNAILSGHNDSTPIKTTTVDINSKISNSSSTIKSANNTAFDYTLILTAMVEILSTIADNTSAIQKILDLLSDTLNIDTSSINTKSSSNKIKEQLQSKLKQISTNNNFIDTTIQDSNTAALVNAMAAIARG